MNDHSAPTDRPELMVATMFAAGFLAAVILKRIVLS